MSGGGVMETKNDIVKTISDTIDMEKIVNTINNIVDAKIIYVFGSYAKGVQRKDSDIDIYIVTDNLNGRIIEKLAEITYALNKIIDMPIDVLLSTTEMFDKRKDFKASVERTVAKEGVALYVR